MICDKENIFKIKRFKMVMFNSFNQSILIRNFAILCMIGNLLYFIFPFPPIVWRLSLVLVSLYCVYINYIRYGLCNVEKAILSFVGINLIYYSVSYLWTKPSTSLIGTTLYILLSFNMFAFLGKERVLTQKFICVSAILLTLSMIPSFYNYQELALEKHTGAEATTVNESVFFLMLLPLLFCIRNRILSIGILCICLFFLVFGAKRGNILAAVLPIVMYIWIFFKESKKSFFKVVVGGVAIIGIAIWVKNLILSNEYFQYRIETTLEGNYSGRDSIYPEMWKLWYNSENIVNILFGYGYSGSFLNSPSAHFAHNDWLEVLVDYGLIGIIVYAMIFVALIRFYFRLENGYARITCLAIMSIWFMKTLYSMAFWEESMVYMSIPFGCLFSRNYFTEFKISELAIK